MLVWRRSLVPIQILPPQSHHLMMVVVLGYDVVGWGQCSVHYVVSCIGRANHGLLIDVFVVVLRCCHNSLCNWIMLSPLRQEWHGTTAGDHAQYILQDRDITGVDNDCGSHFKAR